MVHAVEEEEKNEVPEALTAPEPEKNDDFGDFDDSDESVSSSSSSEESDSLWLFKFGYG